MKNTQLPIQRCHYCGSEDIGLGWQHGEALVTFASVACQEIAFTISLPTVRSHPLPMCR